MVVGICCDPDGREPTDQKLRGLIVRSSLFGEASPRYSSPRTASATITMGAPLHRSINRSVTSEHIEMVPFFAHIFVTFS